jgi:apolipoprotein N-acyltransferase
MLVALASGLLLDLAFPPHGHWWLAPVAVALLTLAVRDQTAWRGAVLGGLHGVGLFFPMLIWSGVIAGTPAWLTLVALESAFLVPLGAALALVSPLRAWPLWSAALWVAQEALRDRIPFGGFPWGRLAFSQAGSPLAPLASLGGAPLVTFAVAAVAAALTAAVLAPVVVGARRTALLGPVLLLMGLVLPTPTGGEQVTVALVQGNVPRLGLDAFAQRAAVLNNHAQATHDLAARVRAGEVPAPDLVIWPENASDLDPYTDSEAFTTIDAAVRDVGVPVLVGAVTDGPGDKISNRGIVWTPGNGPGQTYVKRHPVPFGEYIPFRSLVRMVTKKVDLVPRDFVAADRPGVLQVGPALLGDVICFEVAYDDLVRDVVREGGRLVVVQTNNATFGRSGETTQQLAMGRLRAVEHGRAVLVAATSGVSAVIAPDGSVVDRSEVFTRDLLVQQVPLRSGQTLATRLGALPELLLALLGLGAALVGARRVVRA